MQSKSLKQNFGTFSLSCFSSQDVDTSGGSKRAAAKIIFGANTHIRTHWMFCMQLWLAKQAVIVLNYSWNIIHHNQLQWSLTEKDKMRDTTCKRKTNNKAKRIIWEEDLKGRSELIAGCKLSSSLCLLFMQNSEEEHLSVIPHV